VVSIGYAQMLHLGRGSHRPAPGAGRARRSRGPRLPRQDAHRHQPRPAGLEQALAAVREGDTLTVAKLDRLARSVPDALDILSQISHRDVRFALGGSVYDWTDPFAVIAEFEANPIRQRTREGMDVARQHGKLRGKQSRLKPAQDREIRRMHDSGDYNIAEIAALFSVSRPTVYRSLERTADLPLLPAGTRPVPDVAGATSCSSAALAEKGRPCLARSSGRVTRVRPEIDHVDLDGHGTRAPAS